ncbi:SRPBCC family protein [Tumebacillus permanentifrigoris]|uniref:Uncharacterized protein YndB with AHSA1/START domain n=1 Tax=Tumebacillus permanentifrigoris TaxID=378543 RepID=A0A316DUK4_9BACL|nr:SRPBCC family protein [Tumebacillus permanentifrigoris]PWK12742.1 uncharacterized protein YndB with AHSA1/START domain [Tumebacillus permanentifrigoris]
MEGTVQRIDGGYVIRFECHLKHPVEKVWAAITEPEQLVQWLARAEIELVEGGKFELRFDNTDSVIIGRVREVIAPTVFEFIWNSPGAENSVVRWELQHDAAGCLLVLTHRLTLPDPLPSMLAGWQVHLEVLTTALIGQPIKWPWSRWEELHDQYNNREPEWNQTEEKL